MITPLVEPLGDRYVLRDDLLPGGTKRRAVDALLEGGDEFVYASPAYGYAQVALAVACQARGLRATIFSAARMRPSPLTLRAAAYGATVISVEHGYLNVVTKRARDYCIQTGAVLLPHGFDDPRFRQSLVGTVLTVAPYWHNEVWVAAGSGVLARCIAEAWPTARVVAVQVGHPPILPDQAELLVAPEAFESSARMPPPFPSADNYDAKVWRYFQADAAPGALYWNVGA